MSTTVPERRLALEARIPWGEFNCGKFLPDTGWDEILMDFFDQIDYIGATDKISVVQIKEKFGTLRLYVDPKTDEDVLRDIVYALAANAERRSEFTCERCGDLGRQRGDYWVLTLCNACDELREAARGADL